MLVKNYANSKKVISADGATVFELLNPMSDPIPDEVSVALAIVGKRESTRPHSLAFNEIYYILEGEAVATVNKEEQKLTKGDALYIPRGSVQCMENTGDSDLVFLCICQPAYRPEGDEVVG